MISKTLKTQYIFLILNKSRYALQPTTLRLHRNVAASLFQRMYSSSTDADIVVIGSGPGGYVAAIKAAQLGLKVGISETCNIMPNKSTSLF